MPKLFLTNLILSLILLVAVNGCAQLNQQTAISLQEDVTPVVNKSETLKTETTPTLKQTSLEVDDAAPKPDEPEEKPKDEPDPELLLPEQLNGDEAAIRLEDVIGSIYASFPMIESAMYSRDIALGNNLSAYGAFDLKVKGASENGPLGFYQTYRQSVGLIQPLYSGSEIWGGYRIGRGNFQPWFRERNTNDGGEFKAGVTVPLLRNRSIDERRAELWKTELDKQLAELDIQAQIIGFVQDASYAYWDWIEAGMNYNITKRILDLAESRTQRIKRQVENGLLDPPELTDNLRLVAERRAKLADAQRKLNQKAAKLSLYFRDTQGEPVVPTPAQLSKFPEPFSIDEDQLSEDVGLALNNRPDLHIFDLFREQLDIDLAQANNLMKPDVNAVVWSSQDMGQPTSSKRDKSQYEMEASIYLDVPVQRRKARGKINATEAKIQQIMAKRRFTGDKISVEVQNAYAALNAAYLQVLRTREAVKFAEELAQRERKNFEAGASDLLKVTLREQYAAESAIKEINALKLFYQAQADYQAALGIGSAP